jgi:hypothetical protein
VDQWHLLHLVHPFAQSDLLSHLHQMVPMVQLVQ